MTYLKSETYRLYRKRGLYWTIGTSLGLVILAVLVLYFFQNYTNQFPYGTNRFLYINVITSTPIIILFGFLINRQLIRVDRRVMKQSVSYGIPRKTIYLNKLVLTLGIFIILCLIGISIVTLGGELLLTAETAWFKLFMISIINIVPLVLSAFFVGHAFLMLFSNETLSIILLIVLYSGSVSDILNAILLFFNLDLNLKTYFPGAMLEQVFNDYMNQQVHFQINYWLVGIIISVVSTYLGVYLFEKKDL